MDDPLRNRLLRLLVRIALFATYPFLVISAAGFFGIVFGAAFITEFTVENQTDVTDVTIVVTPIGTVGKQGTRYPLPVYTRSFLPIQSFQCGGFIILPGESTDILYDMDDINFSELVVHDHEGERGQLVINSNPTQNQYHSPTQTHFVIDDLDLLAAVPSPVRNASLDAQAPSNAPLIILGLLFGPWIAFILLSRLNRSLATGNSLSKSPGATAGLLPPPGD